MTMQNLGDHGLGDVSREAAGGCGGLEMAADGLMDGFERFDFDVTGVGNWMVAIGLTTAWLAFATLAGCGVQGSVWPQWSANDPLALLHGSCFAACALLSLSGSVLVRRASRNDDASLDFLRRHRHGLLSTLLVVVVLLWQLCRSLADMRRAFGGFPNVYHGPGAAVVRLEAHDASSLLALPRRVCVDERPWETAMLPTVALVNEDWGCEGRYNSGYGCLTTMTCFSVLANLPICWEWAVATAFVLLLVVFGAALPAGMYGEGLVRQLVLLALCAVLSIHIATERRKDSSRTYLAWQRLHTISHRTRAFLATLLPLGVLRSATVIWCVCV